MAKQATQTTRPRRGAAADHACDEVLIALRRIIRGADLHSKRVMKETGLTTAQLVALQAIRDLGEVTTGALSNRVNLSQATVTTILDRLEARKLIERYRSQSDRRVVHARLTGAGRDALRRAPTLLHEEFRAAYLALDEASQRGIIATLNQVAEMMGVRDLDAAPLLDVGSPAQLPPGA